MVLFKIEPSQIIGLTRGLAAERTGVRTGKNNAA